MRIRMTVGVFHNGQPLNEGEIHDVELPFAKAYIQQGRAIPAPDEVQVPDPPLTSRDPGFAPRVRRK